MNVPIEIVDKIYVGELNDDIIIPQYGKSSFSYIINFYSNRLYKISANLSMKRYYDISYSTNINWYKQHIELYEWVSKHCYNKIKSSLVLTFYSEAV